MYSIQSVTFDHTREFVCGARVLSRLPGLFRELWPEASFYLVADENTYRVCGDRVAALMAEGKIPMAGKYLFPGAPVLHGDYRHCRTLTPLFRNHPGAVPLVIGSGSLNDIVKRASFDADREYAVVATAASVDGYASDGAALLENGVKHTMSCPAPALILADTELLATAPLEMTAAGYGDLLAKYPAGADWILADLAGADPLNPFGWSLVHDRLDEWTANPTGLVRGEEKALVSLFEGLTCAGFAMQYMKQSRPVSGAEHLLSHIWEMSGHTFRGEGVSHGFQVSVGSMVCLSLMHHILEHPLTDGEWSRALELFESPAERESRIEGLFPFLEDRALLYEINREKSQHREAFAARLDFYRKNWGELRRRWLAYLPREEFFRNRLESAGCPSRPGDIGIGRQELGLTLVRAQFLRNRYSVLDLAWELGFFHRMEPLLDRVC